MSSRTQPLFGVLNDAKARQCRRRATIVLAVVAAVLLGVAIAGGIGRGGPVLRHGAAVGRHESPAPARGFRAVGGGARAIA